ncbi:hypothetical protein GUITHDRAFT_153757 [Guillardia theta CCMP2712]|uniref:RING-type domain-containing protein n=1 Tax=Guillardia theta (strain CCMP2712) TaxID=905079 RepID=L1J163_GUITC|nr:hypothetical protein GUITHDRAFT_153757 [Guillardia theta CCMP2712]EKX41810.1 hypothetical protein GUITHDRAFT_153757 [Guillardia theta CCMP2712]|mmetsp:Transcript_1056/g.3286  ORF Transcript_1056/g.3286 Transcript_1056/m.3286 type:complete len:193 (-) Transcript_1056:98-676(-)|eukprot:XP_005828790.1 hypothetical protein GUITHDRAFT_153757 [Guillardia theta CCMP2712]
MDSGKERVKCPNHIMCHSVNEKLYFDCHGGRCLDCNMTYARDFIFFTSEEVSGEECPVCLDTSKENFLKYPCGHYICVDCFYPTMRMDGPREVDFDPEFFSNQTEDITDGISDDLFERWQQEERPEYYAWDRADDKFQQTEQERMQHHQRLLRRCPKCRYKGLPVAGKVGGSRACVECPYSNAGQWIGILSN